MEKSGLLLTFSRVVGPAGAGTRTVPLTLADGGISAPNSFVDGGTGVIRNVGDYEMLHAALVVAVQGVGGTSYNARLQHSFDGTNWMDLAAFQQIVIADAVGTLTTVAAGSYNNQAAPAKGAADSMAAGSIRPGPFGPWLRLRETSVGVYAPPFQYDLSIWFQ